MADISTLTSYFQVINNLNLRFYLTRQIAWIVGISFSKPLDNALQMIFRTFSKDISPNGFKNDSSTFKAQPNAYISTYPNWMAGSFDLLHDGITKCPNRFSLWRLGNQAFISLINFSRAIGTSDHPYFPGVKHLILNGRMLGQYCKQIQVPFATSCKIRIFFGLTCWLTSFTIICWELKSRLPFDWNCVMICCLSIAALTDSFDVLV